MFNLKFFAFSILAHVLLVAGDFSSDRDECMQSTNLKAEDVKALSKDVVPTESQFCFLKCLMEKSGKLTADGMVDMDVMKKCKHFSKIPDSDQKEIGDCLKGIKKVAKCADMEKFYNCFKDVKDLKEFNPMET